VTRLDRMKRGSGIKGRDDRSSGIEIRIAEALAKINTNIRELLLFFFPPPRKNHPTSRHFT
jgi:hypothetical protein